MSTPKPVTSRMLRQAVLITGSTDGIGLTTAKNLAALDSSPYTDIILHGRDLKRIQNAKEVVQRYIDSKKPQKRNSNIRIWTVPPTDISTIQGSRMLVQHVQQICTDADVPLTCLMNNAGVFSNNYVQTLDGLELTFSVNVLSFFVITSLLLPTILQPPATKSTDQNYRRKIVIASSISQSRNIRDWEDVTTYQNRQYSAHSAYSESKLLDAMLCMEFATRLQNAGYKTDRITCNCLDPGTVNTKMLYAGWGPCGIDVRDALDETWLCTDSEVDDVTGRYFVYRRDSKASSDAYDINERNKLWSILSELVPDAANIWKFDWV